jgi:hypothetical protein
MKIYITTYGRVNNQKTLSQLQPVQEHVWLVVQEREQEQYSYSRLLVLPDHIRMLSPTRQWILDNVQADKFLLIDDDLDFLRRDGKTLRKATADDIVEMISWFDDVLDRYMQAGLSSRFINWQGDPEVPSEVQNVLCIAGYRSEIRNLGVRFDRSPLASDYDMTLQLLKMGFPNIVGHKFSYHNVANAPGGCSSYRTNALRQQASKIMQELHPGLLTVVDGQITRVAWKKAYRLGANLV